MKRVHQYLFVRHAHNWLLLLRFGLVGGSGVFVNLLALVMVHSVGPDESSVLKSPVHWYHLYSTMAFALANLWNFQLNRFWTFRSNRHSSWLREYFPFLAVGLLGQLFTLLLLTTMMHPGGLLALPTGVLDDSTGWRTRLYWAQLITIAVVTPLSFVLNKLWTFRSMRSAGVARAADPSRAGAGPEPRPVQAVTGQPSR